MIESVNNERIKAYAKLNDKKYRETSKLFLVEGEHLVAEAVKRGKVKEILLLEGLPSVYKEVTYVTERVLAKVSSLASPPKIMAICYQLDDQEIKGNVLILDDLTDPGNLGTILRSAVAFNYETIVLSPRTVDLYNPKVIRATEGMLFNLNVLTLDLLPLINELKMAGYLIYGTDVTTGGAPSKTQMKHALVIGSEAAGIKPDIMALCDQKLNIKMNPACESLNAAVAASILMHELGKS